jgi:hypothetical protein
MISEAPVSPGSRIDLRDVTLCAVDCVNPLLAACALHACMATCDFADAVLFSNTPMEGRFRNIPIAELKSARAYSAFILADLVGYITTPFVLIVQWDGYIVHPYVWSDDFRLYDYIGAKWPFHADRRVGNGGFSLRSSKLLRAVAGLVSDPSDVPEDELICRQLASVLEQDFAVRFAPEAVADRFSYERQWPGAPTFGFHGLFNFWRHVSDEDMLFIVAALNRASTTTIDYMGCMFAYLQQQRSGPLRAMYIKWRSVMTPDAVIQLMLRENTDPKLLLPFIEACEALIR